MLVRQCERGKYAWPNTFFYLLYIKHSTQEFSKYKPKGRLPSYNMSHQLSRIFPTLVKIATTFFKLRAWSSHSSCKSCTKLRVWMRSNATLVSSIYVTIGELHIVLASITWYFPSRIKKRCLTRTMHQRCIYIAMSVFPTLSIQSDLLICVFAPTSLLPDNYVG